jgi:hypothetical protein
MLMLGELERARLGDLMFKLPENAHAPHSLPRPRITIAATTAALKVPSILRTV